MGGVDARDFIRGARPWSQFLCYTDYLAKNVDGCALWAAQLDDDRILPIVAKRLKARDKDAPPPRPALTGYSREVDALHTVAGELRMLRAEIGKWGEAPPIPGPLFPGEKLHMAELAQEVSDLASAIVAGHQNWEEVNGHAGIQRG